MADNDAAARIDALEIRIAYQDQTIEELNAALASQWREIDRLRREMKLLESEMRKAMAATPGDAAAEPPPPHY